MLQPWETAGGLSGCVGSLPSFSLETHRGTSHFRPLSESFAPEGNISELKHTCSHLYEIGFLSEGTLLTPCVILCQSFFVLRGGQRWKTVCCRQSWRKLSASLKLTGVSALDTLVQNWYHDSDYRTSSRAREFTIVKRDCGGAATAGGKCQDPPCSLSSTRVTRCQGSSQPSAAIEIRLKELYIPFLTWKIFLLVFLRVSTENQQFWVSLKCLLPATEPPCEWSCTSDSSVCSSN